MFIMSFKTALQRDLDRFYKAISGDDFNIRAVTKGALTQARSKLNPWCFKRLNEIAVKDFYEGASYYVWYGMRVLAVDGTRLMLPNHETIREKYGTHDFGPKADAPRSMAMGSALYDTLNHLTIDAEIAPYASSERDLLMKHLENVNAGDMLLLDRGYSCFWLFYLLQAKGISFCVRLKDNWWLKVKDFVESGEEERIVSFSLPKKDQDKLADYPHMQDNELKCRLIRVVLDNGEVEVLCTSLLDTEQYKQEEFALLYSHRWNEEEAYKLLKSRVEIEAFSGKTARAVEQDFYAKVFMMTMCAAFAHPIEQKVVEEHRADKKRTHPQKINRTHALATMMDMIIPMFLKQKRTEALISFDKIVEQTREVIRPGRKHPRKKKSKKPHYINYKPI